MRKTICFIAIAAIVLVPALALAQSVTAQELAAQWEQKGYPDDVGSVYNDSQTGKLVFTLTDNSEARRQELLALVSNPDEVDFGDATYSFNELLIVQEEIMGEMAAQGEAGPIHSVSIGWTSLNGTVIGFGDSGKESRVVVAVDEKAHKEYVAKYKEAYGDKVYVEFGDEAKAGTATFSDNWPAFVIVGAVILFMGVAERYRAQKKKKEE